jgi:FixJ family two-component response regulator
MAAGQKPKQIAAALNISRHTYQRWVTIIRNKLGAITDTQVGVLIERYQLVSVARANVIEDCREERLDARRAGAA